MNVNIHAKLSVLGKKFDGEGHRLMKHIKKISLSDTLKSTQTIINHFFNRHLEIKAAEHQYHSTTLLAVYASKQKEQNGSLSRTNLWFKLRVYINSHNRRVHLKNEPC